MAGAMPVPVTPSKIRAHPKPQSLQSLPVPVKAVAAHGQASAAAAEERSVAAAASSPFSGSSPAACNGLAPSGSSAASTGWPPPPAAHSSARLPSSTDQAPRASSSAANNANSPNSSSFDGAIAGAVGEPLGALLPGVAAEAGLQQERPHLTWDGRWGRWGGADAVYICAPHVATFDIETAGNLVSSSEVIRELQAMLRAELVEEPPGRLVISVHEAGYSSSSGGRNLQVKAALLCRKSRCSKLEKTWQGRSLCGGRASAVWRSTWDSAGGEHVDKVRKDGQGKAWADAASLELPSSWAFRILPSGNCAPLAPSSHWYQFASVFGEVESAELVWGNPFDKALQLVVRFRSVGSAMTMHEMLMGRYLWNPMTQKAHQRNDDAYPLVCVIHDLASLRARALASSTALVSSAGMAAQGHQGHPAARPSFPSAVPGNVPTPQGEQAAHALQVAGSQRRPMAPQLAGEASGPVFQLRRLEPATPGIATELRLAPWRREAVIGRDEDCDLVVRSHHVSKHHAILRLIGEPRPGGGESLTLWIQDKSTNGVWINARRMAKGNLVQLHDQDKISFEADVAEVPSYRVRRFRDDLACDEEEAQLASLVGTRLPQVPSAAAMAAARQVDVSQRVPVCPLDPPVTAALSSVSAGALGEKRSSPDSLKGQVQEQAVKQARVL